MQRIFVHRPGWERFLTAFVDRARALQVGDPLDEKTDVGPLINRDALERVESWVNEAIAGAAFINRSGDAGPGGPQFTGHLLLRNVSSYPVTVNPVLQRGSFVQPLGPATLQSGEVREIVVAPHALPNGPDATGIEIQHTGPPGSAIGYWFSLDPTENLVVETPLKSLAPNAVTSGNNPWSIEGDLAPILYIKNTGDTKASYAVAIQFGAGTYLMGRKEIAAGETVAVDIRKLRNEHVPDANGLTLPSDLTMGQIVWIWKSGPPLVGRVNTMSVSRAIASNMSCRKVLKDD